MNQLAESTPMIALDQWEKAVPRHVFLFSGHMIDAHDRTPPRFPQDKEPLAAAAMSALLEELDADANDMAISSGACGGDLLFVEACLQRHMRVEVYLPFMEEKFLKKSVNFAGEHWRQKFFWVKERAHGWHIMPQDLAPTPIGDDPFARVNLWMLDQALAWGAQNVRFICLWDRKAADGPGGTKHLHDAVIKGSGKAFVLDTTKLW